MIDLNAPIVPGKSAAGVVLGTNISKVIDDHRFSFSASNLDSKTGEMKYTSNNIVLWTQSEKICQIMVRENYQGLVNGVMGVGTSLNLVRSQLGDTDLDEYDNLVIKGIAGLSIEIDVDGNPSTVTEIYVFSPYDIV